MHGHDFDIISSTRLVSERSEFFGLDQLSYEMEPVVVSLPDSQYVYVL